MKHYFLLRMVLFVSVLCAGFVVALAQERQPEMQLNGNDPAYEKVSVLEKPQTAGQQLQVVKEQRILENMSPDEREAYLIKQEVLRKQSDPAAVEERRQAEKSLIQTNQANEKRILYESDRASYEKHFGLPAGSTSQRQTISKSAYDQLPAEKKKLVDDNRDTILITE